MRKYALIVAGGSGSRMKTNVPKQFLLLDNIPVLMHTIQKFSFCDNIIVVLPADHIEAWEKLCATHNFTIGHNVVEGGDTRFASVKNGLKQVDAESMVAIHDGVRPLVSNAMIMHSFEQALVRGSAIPAVLPKNSLRKVSGDTSVHVSREAYREIQTPQTFKSSEIKKAYECSFESHFTDDASVYEHSGKKILLIEGDYRNIKITTPEDLVIAHALLSSEQ